jgi:hypothetical protein
MRYLIAFVLCLPLFSSAQDCTIKKEVDPFSRQQRLTTGFIKLGSISASIVADAKELKLLFSLGEEQCFTDTSTAHVFFEGKKTRTIYKNGTSMNCDGIFTFTYRNTASTPSALQKLTTDKIASITFTTSSGKAILVDLSDVEKEFFRKAAGCLVTESKTLIRQ